MKTSIAYAGWRVGAFTFLRNCHVFAVSCLVRGDSLELTQNFAPFTEFCGWGHVGKLRCFYQSSVKEPVGLMAASQPQSDLPPEPPRAIAPAPPSPDLRTDIQLEHLQLPPGEGRVHHPDRHTLFVSLTPRPIQYHQAQDGKTHEALYRHGDFTVTPADLPFFARWQDTENCLQLQLSDRFLHSVAQETLANYRDHLTLVPTFQSRNGQIAAIATLILTELQHQQPGGALYLDSLTQAIAVQLLRQHGSTQPTLPQYDGGLPPYQLRRVLDYVDTHLTQDIKLADLAQLLDMSPFHFGRMFKQAIGISPHQYVIQQRVERAKTLLQRSDRAIIDIALDCGFSSHSHLTKQFRRLTGTTPKAFRQG
jgi:AraC family transcriptional regulator